jgi:hypothetical protein
MPVCVHLFGKSRDYADCRMHLEAAADILGDAAPLKDRRCLRRAGTEENYRSAKGDPLTVALCVARGGNGSSDTAPLDRQPIDAQPGSSRAPRPSASGISVALIDCLAPVAKPDT